MNFSIYFGLSFSTRDAIPAIVSLKMKYEQVILSTIRFSLFLRLLCTMGSTAPILGKLLPWMPIFGCFTRASPNHRAVTRALNVPGKKVGSWSRRFDKQAKCIHRLSKVINWQSHHFLRESLAHQQALCIYVNHSIFQLTVTNYPLKTADQRHTREALWMWIDFGQKKLFQLWELSESGTSEPLIQKADIIEVSRFVWYVCIYSRAAIENRFSVA